MYKRFFSLRNAIAVITCIAAVAAFVSCKKESSDKQITAFSFTVPPAVGVIDEMAKTITVEVPSGTDVTQLVPTITVSAEAIVSPVSGVAIDFTNPVIYTVTAEDGSTASYTVTVAAEPIIPPEPDEYTAAELQKMSAIKTRYKAIQTNFSGGYFVTTPTVSPYSIGEVKNEVLQAGVDAVNLVRYIAGLPDDVVLDAEYVDLCQHGAVLLTAIDKLDHTPSKPDDMDEEFFQKGYQATSRSNLSTVNVPSTTVFRYMDDNGANNLETVGHRRWILNPPMKKTGFGVGAARYGVMYAFDKSRSGTVDYDYITWPSPGVFPTEFIDYILPWSITVNAQKYGTPDANKITVTVKNLKNGEIWTFSNNSSATPDTYFGVNKGGYGINNCIIFRPALSSLFKYQEGDVYEVTVAGLDKELSYKVKMFSMSN